MTAADVLIQRLAEAIEMVLQDEDDLRLFRDWLELYRARRRLQQAEP